MIAIIYEYDENGKLKDTKKVVTHFNEQGYIKEEIHYSNDIVSYIIFKEYDKDGLLIKSNDYTNVYYTHEYEYDKDGNLVETIREKEKNKNDYEKLQKITYDKNGKRIKVQAYYQNEYIGKDIKVSGLSKYIKDEKRGMFELISDLAFFYDKNGNLKEVKSEYSNESKKMVIFEALGDGKYKEISAYSDQQYVTIYDKNGNLTEQIGKYVEIDEKQKDIGNIKEIAEKKIIEYTYYN